MQGNRNCKRRYQCNKCKFVTRTETKLNTHLESHKKDENGITEVCKNCGEGFENERELINHGKSEHPNLSCQICDKVFNSKKNLRCHNQTKHPDLVEADEISEKLLKERQELKRCLTGGNRDKKYKCQGCNKKYFSSGSFQSHQFKCKKLKDAGPEKKHCKFSCQTCGKIFSNKIGLDNHKVQHTGEKPFNCHLCQETFKYKCQLSVHKKRFHLGITNVTRDSMAEEIVCEVDVIKEESPLGLTQVANKVGQQACEVLLARYEALEKNLGKIIQGYSPVVKEENSGSSDINLTSNSVVCHDLKIVDKKEENPTMESQGIDKSEGSDKISKLLVSGSEGKAEATSDVVIAKPERIVSPNKENKADMDGLVFLLRGLNFATSVKKFCKDNFGTWDNSQSKKANGEPSGKKVA